MRPCGCQYDTKIQFQLCSKCLSHGRSSDLSSLCWNLSEIHLSRTYTILEIKKKKPQSRQIEQNNPSFSLFANFLTFKGRVTEINNSSHPWVKFIFV